MIPVTPLQGWMEERLGGPFSPEQLRGYHLRKLRETVAYLKRKSPFYRRHLAGFNPEALCNLADLAEWPLTTAEDLQEKGPLMVCVPQDDINRVVTLPTSGTTAGVKRVWFTRSDQELTRDFFHRGMSTFTGAGATVLIGMPGPRPGSIGPLLREALVRLGARGIVVGPLCSLREAVYTALEERATHFVGLPRQASALAAALHERGDGGLKTYLLSGDYVPESLRKRMETSYGAAVYDHYGMTETGYGGAVFCQARQGYHLRELDLFFEIIDPLSREPVMPGVWGELVVTTLTRQGMPFFRYRTGDIGRWISEPCPCGSHLRRMDKVAGRLDDALALPGGTHLYRTVWDEHLFSLEAVIDYTIKQDPLLAEIYLRRELDRWKKRELQALFPGTLRFHLVSDYSFEGPQKGCWTGLT